MNYILQKIVFIFLLFFFLLFYVTPGLLLSDFLILRTQKKSLSQDAYTSRDSD